MALLSLQGASTQMQGSATPGDALRVVAVTTIMQGTLQVLELAFLQAARQGLSPDSLGLGQHSGAMLPLKALLLELLLVNSREVHAAALSVLLAGRNIFWPTPEEQARWVMDLLAQLSGPAEDRMVAQALLDPMLRTLVEGSCLANVWLTAPDVAMELVEALLAHVATKVRVHTPLGAVPLGGVG